ncbi:hypothetical protein QBC34DRAFT_381752 [Podospora aff. communis PSN243]|uniref:Extracellular membrane protein CFEM domain-containing protein n=1 Tax=Podospora aff. communis PSN243 TaxID=3040156 RepID=A0AAV9GKN9_9PEZI|nr:hypothetical protein QBC34DRAFT_381752 [Podospora aff. communis PSN243]
MKAALVSLAFFASAAVAQTTACAADYIVEACLGTENGKLASCAQTDYVCRCNAFGNILTCFNNCPNDVRRFDYQGQQQIFCGYASQYPSTTTKAVAATGTAATVPTDKADEAASSAAGSGKAASGSATTSAPNTVNTNSAADLALNAGGILAAVAGVVAAVL